MKVLIDLGHPAHIHYFKNLIWIMQEKGHEFCLVSRDKEVLHTLLKEYKFEFTSRGKGSKSLIGKLLYILKADYIIYKVAKKFNPDIFLSFASTYAAHVSKIIGKPHVVLDDTEHAKFELMMYPPFSTVILNPSCFDKHFSSKQLFFNSYMELFYLNPKYFTPNRTVISSYGIGTNEKFFILRFVSWNASHDMGQKGLTYQAKIDLVKKLKQHGKVLISSESELPIQLEEYKIRINPAHLHHFLAYTSLYIGEGSTTASECAVLGTPNIYVNSLIVGYCKEQEFKYQLCNQILTQKDLFDKIDYYIKTDFSRSNYTESREKMLKDKIDGTTFLVWFLENYPKSEKIMRENPEFQYNFK